MSNFRTSESTASHRARSPFHCSKISSFWTRLTETLPPLREGAVQLPRCIVRARESTRGPLFRSKRFKRSYMSFFRTRTTRRFVFPFPACVFAGLYIARAVKTTRTNTKGPAGGIYGHREEEEAAAAALFHSEKFHSLKRTNVFPRVHRNDEAGVTGNFITCNLIALPKIATSRQPRKTVCTTLTRCLFPALHDATPTESKS